MNPSYYSKSFRGEPSAAPGSPRPAPRPVPFVSRACCFCAGAPSWVPGEAGAAPRCPAPPHAMAPVPALGAQAGPLAETAGTSSGHLAPANLVLPLAAPVGGVLVTGSWCWGIFIRETSLLGCGVTKSAQVQPSSWVTGSTGNTRDLATGLAASTRPSSPDGPAHGPRAEAVPQPLSAVGGGDAPAPSASPRASSSGRRVKDPLCCHRGISSLPPGVREGRGPPGTELPWSGRWGPLPWFAGCAQCGVL